MNIRNEFSIHFNNLESSSNNARLNSTLVGTSKNLEESLVSPSVIPGIGNKPVGSSILNSPSNHLHGMSSKLRSRDVLVDSTFVAHEVLIHSEGGLNRSILQNLLLDVSRIRRDRVTVSTKMLRSREGRSINASRTA